MKLSLTRIFLAFTLFCTPAFAASFYADSTCGTNGNGSTDDCSDGASGPFNSISTALARINDSTIDDGDTLYLIKGSSWSINSSTILCVTNSGSSGSGHITIDGDYGTGDMPKIVRDSGSATVQQIFQVPADYIKIKNFEIDGGGPTYGGTGLNIDSDGNCSGSPPDGDIDHIEIVGMYVHDVHTTAGNQYTIGIQIGGDVPADNILVEDNIVENYGAWGLNQYSNQVDYATYRGNKVTNSITGSAQRHGGASGPMQFQNYGGNNVVEYNYLSDAGTDTAGICFLHKYGSGTFTNNIIRYNFIQGPGGNNYADGIEFIGEDAGGSVTSSFDVYGNIITGWQGSGIEFEDSGLSWAGGAINIYNNTIYGNATSSGSITDWAEIHLDNGTNLTVTIKNNILFTTDTDAACLMLESWDGTLSAQNNNLYWHSSGTSEYAIYNTGGTDYTIINVKTGEPTAQNTDPDFVAAGTNFSVNPGSDAINNGADLGSGNGLTGVVKSDWTSQTVSSSDLLNRDPSWDIGAYEYGGTLVPVMKGIQIGKND